MIFVNALVAFSDQNADRGAWKTGVQFFNETAREDSIADKSCLNDKYVVVRDQSTVDTLLLPVALHHTGFVFQPLLPAGVHILHVAAIFAGKTDKEGVMIGFTDH